MREFRNRMQTLFEEDQASLGDLSGLDDRLLRDALERESRPPRRGQWAAGALAAFLGLLLVGTLIVTRASFQPHPQANRPDELVPWLNSPASPPTMSICRGVDLIANELGSNGAGGNVITSIGFAGKGPGSCYLSGTPAITLLGAGGTPISASQRPSSVPQPQPRPVLILPGSPPAPHHDLGQGQGVVTVDWETQPATCGDPAGVSVDAIEIGLGGDRLVVPLAPGPRAYLCNGFGVGVFQGPPQSVTGPDAGIQALPITVLTMRAPSTASAGDMLRYEVELANSGAKPIEFRTACIVYEEELVPQDSSAAPLGGKHFYHLNCDAAPSLAPGQRIKFEVVYLVPKDAPPGNYYLQFTLLTGPTANPPIEAKVSILH